MVFGLNFLLEDKGKSNSVVPIPEDANCSGETSSEFFNFPLHGDEDNGIDLRETHASASKGEKTGGGFSLDAVFDGREDNADGRHRDLFTNLAPNKNPHLTFDILGEVRPTLTFGLMNSATEVKVEEPIKMDIISEDTSRAAEGQGVAGEEVPNVVESGAKYETKCDEDSSKTGNNTGKLQELDSTKNNTLRGRAVDPGDAMDLDLDLGETVVSGNPKDFIHMLRNQFGSTEEFGQFERYFYSLQEEVQMYRSTAESLRSNLGKTQEEKRVLELQLVSEKALRDQESKNSLMDLEKNNMQLNTQIYSMKCEVETWKRKAEATLKESQWLKQQLKSLELEKTDAVRKVQELTRQNKEFEQFRFSIEAYAKRQRDAIVDIKARLSDLEKAKEGLIELTHHNQKQMNFMAVHLRNRESVRLLAENRNSNLESELIRVKSELVQNSSKLSRIQDMKDKTQDVMDKLVSENRDLHCGLTLVLSTVADNIGLSNLNFVNGIGKLHEEVSDSVKAIQTENNL